MVSSKFTGILKAHREGRDEASEPPVEHKDKIVEPPAPVRIGRPKTGKRSNVGYIQVTAYLRRDIHRAVKRELIDEDFDFSDLVGTLLEGWLKSR